MKSFHCSLLFLQALIFTLDQSTVSATSTSSTTSLQSSSLLSNASYSASTSTTSSSDPSSSSSLLGSGLSSSSSSIGSDATDPSSSGTAGSTQSVSSSSIASSSSVSNALNLSSTSSSASNATGSFSNASLDLNVTGTGSAYASSCDSAWSVYSEAQLVFFEGSPGLSTSTGTYNNINTLGPVSVACGGSVTYAVGPPTGLSTSTFVVTLTVTTYAGCNGGLCHPLTASFTQQPPNCAIDSSDCVNLYESWITANSAVMSDSNGVLSLDSPNCNLSPEVCGVCTIYAGTVDLYYFAVPSTVSRDLCATTPGPLPQMPTPNASQSAVVNGSTFYANKAYMSFEYLEAWNACNGDTSIVGASHSGDIIELNSADVSSLRWPNLGVQYPVNFADFNTPIPLSAFEGISFCYYQECSTVGQIPYAPILAVPSAVRNLDPAWANCALAFNGVYDPPYALATQSVLGPNYQQASSSAMPESVPTNAAPPVTNAPTPTQPQPQSAAASNSNLGNVIASAIVADVGGQTTFPNVGASNQQQPQQQQQSQQQNPQPTTDNLGDIIASAVGMAVVDHDVSASNSPVNDQELPQSAGSAQPSGAGAAGAIAISPNGQSAIIGGNVASQGGPPVTVGGTIYSLGSSGLVVSNEGGGPAITIPIPQGNSGSGTIIPITTIAGTPAYGEVGFGGAPLVVIGGQTLSLGGPPVTISGTVVSLGTSGLVVGGSTTLPVTVTSIPASVSALASSASSNPSRSSSSSSSGSSSSTSSVTSASSSSIPTATHTTKKSNGEMLHVLAASFSAILAFTVTVVLVPTAFC